jgi:putative redox protein
MLLAKVLRIRRTGGKRLVRIDIRYDGELHCHAVHAPSGSVLETDAPLDNHGRGATFSPTDLLATGLGTCMLTVMGILARERGYVLDGTRVSVIKHMTPPPRRVARLDVTLEIPAAGAAGIDPPGSPPSTCPSRSTGARDRTNARPRPSLPHSVREQARRATLERLQQEPGTRPLARPQAS